ncbi:MAG: hypothetical protein EBT15_11840 [Betaproteobacteria bacterium]|nr:hypothetical protein [Betaproteobacteria bacterium]
MKTHFSNRAVPPVTAEQLRSVGVDPSDLWWSPTFHSWMFCGPLAAQNPYATTGATLAKLGLTPNPDA